MHPTCVPSCKCGLVTEIFIHTALRSSSHACIFEDVVSIPSKRILHSVMAKSTDATKPHTKTNCSLETLTSLYTLPFPQDSSSNKHIIVDKKTLFFLHIYPHITRQSTYWYKACLFTIFGFVHCSWSWDVNVGDAPYVKEN